MGVDMPVKSRNAGNDASADSTNVYTFTSFGNNSQGRDRIKDYMSAMYNKVTGSNLWDTDGRVTVRTSASATTKCPDMVL